MLPILLGLGSAVLFGALSPVLGLGYRRVADAEVAGIASTAVALVVATAAALAARGEVTLRGLALFAAAGVVAPGLGQLLFMRAIRDAGPSRSSVVVGTAPLFAVAVALLALGEPLRAPLLAGAFLIVAGGAALARERRRPEGFRAAGLLFALGCAVAVGLRDNAARWAAQHAGTSAFAAGAAALGGGTVSMLAFMAVRRGVHPAAQAFDRGRALLPFVPAGLLYGLSYVLLFAAFYRGRVSVVSPVVATESLWSILVAAALFGRGERIGRRLVAGGALVVAGAALIGAYR